MLNIDGFNNEPAFTLDVVGKAQIKMGNKNVIVPVIWPSEGSFAYYNEDRYVQELHFCLKTSILFESFSIRMYFLIK